MTAVGHSTDPCGAGFPWRPPRSRPPKPFEAYTDCPKCGCMDFHWLRKPLPKPEVGPVRVFPDGTEIHSFTDLTGPDESMYEVIRICTACSAEWGQT